MVTVHVVDQKPIFQLHQQNRKMVALINFLYQGNSLFEVLAENFVPLNSEVFLNLSIAESSKNFMQNFLEVFELFKQVFRGEEWMGRRLMVCTFLSLTERGI